MAKQVLFIDDWEVPKLVKYAINYNKLWADDSGRDMSGENKATLIGVFPKLNVEVGCFNKDEMSTFLSKVNKAKVTVKWYDAESDSIREGASYYANDFTIDLKSSKRMVYKPFSFNLIPNKKR